MSEPNLNASPALRHWSPPFRMWLIAMVLYTLVVGYLLRGFRHDDAYITFRYAQNVVLGRGLVFNPGERVLGTTSVLQTLLSIPIYAIAGEATPVVANYLGVASIAVSSWLMWWLTATLVSRRWAIWVAAATALGVAGQFPCVALETNLTLALVLGAFCLSLKDRYIGAAVLMGLAYLARPDSVVAIPTLLILYWIRRRSIPWAPALVFLVIAGAWHLFAWRYYGVLFTGTLGAKYGSVRPWTYLLQVIGQYRDLAVNPFAELTGKVPAVGVFENLIFVPLVIGAACWLRAGRVAVAVALYPILLFLGYAVIGSPTDQLWHTMPAAAFGAACLVIGLGRIGEYMAENVFEVSPRHGSPVWATILVAAFTGVHAAGAVQFIRRYPDMFWYGQRDAKYTAIAQSLTQIVHPGEKVLTWEVGTLAFKSDLSYVDGLGLISPGIRGISSADGSVPRTSIREIIRLYDPQWVLILAHFAEGRVHPEWLEVSDRFELHTRFDAPPFMKFDLFRRKAGR